MDTLCEMDVQTRQFVDWLIAMGCPPEIITMQAVSRMFRGYYMVWNRLSPKVVPKEIVKEKRLQILCADIRRSLKPDQKYNPSPTVVSKSVKYCKTKAQLSALEAKVAGQRQTLKKVADNFSTKLLEHKLLRCKNEESSRSRWFHLNFREEMKMQLGFFNELKATTECVCNMDLRSNTDESNNQKSKFDSDFSSMDLYKRRMALEQELDARLENKTLAGKRACNRSAMVETIALYAKLSLEKLDNRMKIKSKYNNDFIRNVSEDDKVNEYFKLKCDLARREAKIGTRRTFLRDLKAGTGVFASHTDDCRSVVMDDLEILNDALVTKKNEIKASLLKINKTEKKTHAFMATILYIINEMKRVIEPELLEEKIEGEINITLLRHFYQEYFDVTAKLPSFLDEVRLFNEIFNLRDNKKLHVTSMGDIYAFQTLEASAQRLQRKLLQNKLSTTFFCPTVSVTDNLQRLIGRLTENQRLNQYNGHVGKFKKYKTLDLNTDFAPQTNSLDERNDVLKKEIYSNNSKLNKVNNATLYIGELLQLWSKDPWSDYVAHTRTVKGRPLEKYIHIYKQYVKESQFDSGL